MKRFEPTTLRDLADRYDCFFVDQYGVLRDAGGLLEGAREALAFLRAAGRTVIILSNSGQDGSFNARRLATLGIEPDAYTAFVTSGDTALALWARPDPPLPLRPGARCLSITSGAPVVLPERLGLVETDRGEDADLVLIAGSRTEDVGMAAYEALLRPAAARGVPALCTNPDFRKLIPSGTAPGPGAIAELYADLGGPVIWIGKPHAAIYEQACAAAGQPARDRIVCIGDSLDHDVVGAEHFGLDSVLVGTGLAAGLDDDDLMAAAERAGAAPPWFMRGGFRP